LKQFRQIFSTEAGIQIDETEQLQNAYFSIHTSLEPDSNVTANRNSHSEKQEDQIVSTDEGIQISIALEMSPSGAKLSTRITVPATEIRVLGNCRETDPDRRPVAFIPSER
jgi:alpha-acetolactate decarboxylase